MPKAVEIEIFNIARTRVNALAVKRWLDHIGVSDDFDTNPDITEPAFLIALAAKRCYKSFEPGLNPNVTRVRENYVEYFDNILRSGHGSVLEHASYTYAIEGVSRVFTAEMNRHRAGWSISEGSLRFIRFDEQIEFWMPESIRDNPDDDDDLAYRKIKSRICFNQAFEAAEDHYRRLMQIWDMDEGNKNFAYKKKVTSQARRVVPMGVATGGVWTGNIRALRHVMALRTAPGAEEEIAHVFCRIAADLIQREPMLFQDFAHHPELGYIPKYPKVL